MQSRAVRPSSQWPTDLSRFDLTIKNAGTHLFRWVPAFFVGGFRYAAFGGYSTICAAGDPPAHPRIPSYPFR